MVSEGSLTWTLVIFAPIHTLTVLWAMVFHSVALTSHTHSSDHGGEEVTFDELAS